MKAKAIIVGIVVFSFGLFLIVSRGSALVGSASGEMQITRAEEAVPSSDILGDEAAEYEDANAEEDPLAEEQEGEGDESEYQWLEEEPEGQDSYEYVVPEDIVPEEDSNQ